MKKDLLLLVATFALASSPLAHAQSPTPSETPASPVTMGNLVADYEALLRAADPSAKAREEDRSVRRWRSVSPEDIAELAERARSIKAELGTLEAPPMPDAAILEHLLDQVIVQDDFDTARIPFTGDWGFHAEPFFAASNLRLRSEDEAEAWIARLNDVPRYFADNVTNMKRGVRTGWTGHADPLETMIDQVRGQVVDTPEESALWAPFESLPEYLTDEKKAAIRAAGREAVYRAVEAYRSLLVYLEQDYALNTRPEPGIGSLPDGKAYYEAAIRTHTAGAGYTPDEIHEIGEEEVARIRSEMEEIIVEIGYPGSFEDFLTFLRTDPQFYAKTPEDLMEKASRVAKRLDAVLPEYFGKLPRLTYGVEPVPASIAPGYTTGRYSGGNPEGGVAGTYLVNTYALDQRPLYELPALTAHEAVPGHHLQISLAQELEDVPDFRREYYATAFGEGWGLYAEKLAGEAGIYETPYERFGALSYEMWRACRLVADTGLHWYGWSREKAEQCFEQNSALAPLNIKTEVTRYIGWPGQATAYKIGQLKILDLRARAKDALGADFDIRAFHDAVLDAGSMPLDALERRIDAWIETQKDTPETELKASAP
ncbi:DUF885 domain-containing protein [Henriciella aquimarina]|uniref:DUF885 domain-containing protein n=1 Tax=Henriciella aquimarina TaxID=545261 RepID=UPI000A031F5B|nr:DUF885 domain-containing protein [Henriciella aquimarina]